MSEQIPLRLLRAEADAFDPDPPELSPRQQRRRERILTLAPILLASHGLTAISFTMLAFALRLDRATLRFLFPDIPALVGEVLTRHLTNILQALAALPPSIAGAEQKRRDAYRALTRTPHGNFTPAHTILLRDLADLPEDVREPLQYLNAQIPLLLARENGAEIRATLDSLEATPNPSDPPIAPDTTPRDLDTTQIETVLDLLEPRSPHRPLAMRLAPPDGLPPLTRLQQP